MIYSRLEDGSDLFLRMDWIRSCAKCIRRGLENKCNHVEPRPSHFEPRGALKRQKALISPFGKEAFETELLNQAAANNRTPVFRSEWLQALRDGTNDWPSAQWSPHVPLGDFDEFFIGIDPAGGGFSRLILLAVIMDRTRGNNSAPYQCVVVACEAVGKLLVDMDLGDIIVDFALQVRATVQGLRHARAIICIENNSILVSPSSLKNERSCHDSCHRCPIRSCVQFKAILEPATWATCVKHLQGALLITLSLTYGRGHAPRIEARRPLSISCVTYWWRASSAFIANFSSHTRNCKCQARN